MSPFDKYPLLLLLIPLQDPALLAAEMAFSMQQHQRIVGYDALAVDWADYSTLQAHTAAGNSCSHANVDHADETAETSLALHQHLQQIARQGRVTGYDAPAVDPDQLLLSAAGNAAAAAVGVVTIGSAGGVQRDELQAARQYYKNPCNCPNARDLFKNNNDHHGHRVYYKNPANAPIFLSEKEMRVSRVPVLTAMPAAWSFASKAITKQKMAVGSIAK